MRDKVNGGSVVTIGIPVFNGERHIRRALESVLNQTFEHFILLVSDNASTDGTRLICESLIGGDRRAVYFRQPKNIRAARNFAFLLERAKTEYFVFLAADDYWDENYLQSTVSCLEKAPAAVACISMVAFEKGGKATYLANGSRAITGTPEERLISYLRDPEDNSRFYALFRRETLLEAFRGLPSFHALDWYLMAITLWQGDHLQLNSVLMHREKSDLARYLNSVKQDNVGFVGEYFPVYQMSLALIKRLHLQKSFPLLRALLALNLWKHRQYVIHKHGPSLYTRLLRFI